jgi:cytochrome c553
MRKTLQKSPLAWGRPIIIFLAAMVIAAITIIALGIYNIAADRPHPQGWARLLHFAFERSAARHSRTLQPPEDLDADWRVALGAAHYGHVCSSCHGAPGLGQNVVALQMRPLPPDLTATATRFDNRELAWIVLHGVKYSGMPAWPAGDRTDEVWTMVAFLRSMPQMDAATYRRLAYGEERPVGRNHLTAEFGNDPAARPMQRGAIGISDYATVTPATGFSNFAILNRVVPMCSRCHGAAGTGSRGRGAVPNLTLQDKGYLRQSLRAYADSSRNSGIMGPVASQLSAPQIDALAEKYAEAPAHSPVDAAAGRPGVMDAGRSIATAGIPDRDIAACASCHGASRMTGRYVPQLRGQYAQYLVNQLRLFAAGKRGDVEAFDPMYGIAHKLEANEIRAVAAWYSAQPARGNAGDRRPMDST